LLEQATFKAPNDKSSTQVQHVGTGFLTVAEAAKILNKSVMTITRWCQSGKLPAISKSYGKKITYSISCQAISVMQKPNELMGVVQSTPVQHEVLPHSEYLMSWVKAMELGLLTGKPYSRFTVEDYEKLYMTPFLKEHGALSIRTFKAGLMAIPVEQFAKRDHFYKAVRCFAKFLVKERAIDAEFLEDMAAYKPKRHLPPKRHTVSQDGLDTLLNAANTLLDKTLIQLIASTGLRASELCSLRCGDIDFTNTALTVRLGKGNKSRRVGLNAPTIALLREHLSKASNAGPDDPVFVDKSGKQLHRHGLYQRLERIGKEAGVEVSPHALRRAFVTLNANKGRPLQMLQMACGHSDIKTTRSYCLTSEQEVIEAMKDW
jgi:excisionase family DNA binding protein